MGLKFAGILLLTLSFSAAAMDAPVVDRWWGEEYQQLQKRGQVEQMQKAATRCDLKIDYYHKKLMSNPSSNYYRYKLRSWRKRCETDAEANPYIKK